MLKHVQYFTKKQMKYTTISKLAGDVHFSAVRAACQHIR